MLEQRQLLAGDVQVRFEFVDSSQNVVSTLSSGEAFTVRAYVQDIQTIPDGISRAYFDVNYDSALATPSGSITHGAAFNIATGGDLSTVGVIDEVGGADTDFFPNNLAAESLLFSVPFTASDSGTFSLTIDDAETATRSIQLYDTRQIATSEVMLVGASIEISSGVQITPTSGLVTTEAGGTATFTAVLSSQPSSNVTFSLTSSNLVEGTVSPSSLTFTNTNWNQAQTVTVTGANDAVDDGDVAYTIVTGDLVSSDGSFNGTTLPDVAVTNSDDDIAGVTVSPLSGLQTNESGTTDSFAVRLNSQPTADVTIPFRSSNPSEATLSTTSLIFTDKNWDIDQTVTLTGADDDVDDGDSAFVALTNPAISTDANYSGLNASDVSGVNVDNDNRGLIVSPTTGLVINENGGTATFTVRLQTQPTGEVSVPLIVSDVSEATIDTNSLVFSTANWNVAQTVTITGLNDDLADGNVDFFVRTGLIGGTSDYSGLDGDDVSVANIDNDVAGVIVAPTSGLQTSESGGSAGFTVVLATQPTSPVTIALTSSDPTEGNVVPTSLVFTASNWDQIQTASVTGVDDDLADDDVVFTIVTSAASSDPAYNNIEVADVSAINMDDDVAGVLVQPTSGLVTSEAGASATFNARLTAMPTSNVVIGLSSSDSGEGIVSASNLTFTPSNWNTPQSIEVTGVDDSVDDGDVSYTIVTAAAVSSDPAFSNIDVADVLVANQDNDATAINITPVSGLVTDESGQTASFQVALGTQPTANVSIGFRSSNESEGTINQSSLDFTPQNWDVPQSIVVTGVDDAIDDGDVNYQIISDPATSTDASYDGFDGPDVSVSNSDDDSAGIIVNPTAGLQTTEADAGTASFTIRLTSQPTSSVTIGLSSSDPSEGDIDQPSVVFTSANWDVPQAVTISGVDDLVDDDDVSYTILTSPATSTDQVYDGMNADDVSVTNIDNDVPGVAVSPTSGLITSERGQTASFDLVLTSQPVADVTVNLSSSNENEGSVSAPSVTFSPSNWNTPQTVTVIGADDLVVDGSVAYSIETSAAISSDPVFAGIDPPDVSLINQDDDTASLTVAAATVVEGTGGSESLLTFDVVLSNAVVEGFSVDFSTSDVTAIAADGDYIAETGTLTFAGAQNEVQSITVRVNHDAVVEADESMMVGLSNLTGITADLAPRLTLPTVAETGTITNDDTAAITLTGPAATDEGTSTTDTILAFTATLSADVQGGVTIGYSTSDGTATVLDDDYTENVGTISFAGTAGEMQTVNVIVRADEKVEPDETFLFSLGALSDVPDTAADDITTVGSPLTATITDDDVPRLTLSNVTTSPVEGTGSTTTQFSFDVTLSDAVQDADGFQVPFSITDGTATSSSGDYQADDGVLSFVGDALETQTITVIVNQDSIVETDETFTVELGAISGLDGSETVRIANPTLQATIENDDTAELTLVADTSNQTEGGEFELTVMLSAEIEGGFTVDYSANDGTATVADADFQDAGGILTFNGNAGEMQTFTIQSVQDDKVERNETLTVELTGLPVGLAGAITIDDPVTLTLANDDSATITLIAPDALLEGNGADTTELVFEVVLSAPVQDGFALSYQTINGTATSTNDFTANSGTLDFAGAAESQQVRVQVTPDSIVEADETLQMMLGMLSGLPDGVANSITISTANAVATILNDDAATLSITGPGRLVEGTGDSTTAFEFNVTLSDAVQDGLTIAYNSIDGTATIADSDFQPNSASLTFNGTAGEMQTVTVNVTADDRIEPDEDFSVMLGAITGLPTTATSSVTLGNDTATAIIANDDFPRLVLTDVTASNSEGTSSGSTTAFEFTVTLTDAVNDSDGFQVPVIIGDGSATLAGGDFQDASQTLQFAGNAMESQTITVLVNQDRMVELDETFTVSLGAIIGLAANQTVLVETDSLTATIADDDSASLTLTSSQSTLDEGDSGTTDFVFDVSLSAPVQGGFSLAYSTNDGTATVADNDYVDNDATLFFASEETRQITVQASGDTKLELNEMFTVVLGAISGLDASVADRLTFDSSSVAGTIVNDDAASLSITGPASVTEGTSNGTTTVTFDVTLDHAVSSGFSVDYQTTDGTATAADNDYITNNGSLAFAGSAGETQTISVLVSADNRIEFDESFQLALGQVTGLDEALASLVTVDTDPVSVAINNDDMATIGFVVSDSNVLEMAGNHNVTVRLTVPGGGTLDEPLTVNVIVRDGGTSSSGDFTLASTTITFPAGSNDGATQDVSIGLTQDGMDENAETILLGLELPAGTNPAISLASQDTHAVSVLDDTMDAVLSGRAWVDANNDGLLNVGELTIPSVAIRLSGVSTSGGSVELQTTTDQNGFYQFTELPAGTYSISQVQPSGFVDGQVNQFDAVTLSPGQVSEGLHFGERGLAASQVVRYRVLARPRTSGLLGNALTSEMVFGATLMTASSSFGVSSPESLPALDDNEVVHAFDEAMRQIEMWSS